MQITEVHFADETEARVEVTFTQDGAELSGNWTWPIRDEGKAEAVAAFLSAQVPPLVKPGQKPVPPKTGADVNAERDRRILAGTVINVTGYGNIPVTGTKDDKDVFLARRIIAAEADANGVTAAILVFRDRENVNHNLTPSQMVELADKGFAWIEAMMVRSWEMKDGTGAYAYVDEENPGGIPNDLDDDSHWPVPA